MLETADKIVVSCEIEVTLKIIGGKCKPLILYTLLEDGPKRYGELRSFVCNIPKKTLTAQLRDMEADGLITRTVYPGVPAKVEYAATDLGRTLHPVLEAMCDWGYRNMGDRFILTNQQCNGED